MDKALCRTAAVHPLAASISVTTVRVSLEQLLDDYQSEKAESQQDGDTYYVGYWDSAIQTIYEVAAALNIPFDDPWVDPSWVRSVEYQTMLRTTRTGKRQGERQKEQSSYGMDVTSETQ